MGDDTRAQNTTMVLAIAAVFVVGTIVVTIAVFGGVVGPNDGSTRTQTAVPTATSTAVPTGTVVSTVTTMSTLTSTPTSTPMPTSTPTPTPTPTSTSTPTPTPTPNYPDYDDFVSVMFGEAQVDTDIPLRIRGYRTMGEELVMIMNLTARSEDDLRRAQEVNMLVSAGFVQAVQHYDNGKVGSDLPDRFVIAEVNNTDVEPKWLYVNTTLARTYYQSEMSSIKFTDRYWDTLQNQTAHQQRLIRKIDKVGGNVSLTPQDDE